MTKRILLLENDSTLAKTIKELLESEDYAVTLAQDGNEASNLTYEEQFDLYIFEIDVPEIDGLSLLKALRNAGDTTPTMFISSLLDIETISMAFDIGAEEYIKKPFLAEEILIRVNAKFKENNQKIKIAHLLYDEKSKTLSSNNQIIPMGEVQLCLFEKFFYNQNRVIERTALCDCLGHNSPGALRVALNKLKQTTQLSIKNVRSIGYILEIPTD